MFLPLKILLFMFLMLQKEKQQYPGKLLEKNLDSFYLINFFLLTGNWKHDISTTMTI
jgi:hypothetical protein